MLEKGLVWIREIPDGEDAFPPPLAKLGNAAGGKQSRSC